MATTPHPRRPSRRNHLRPNEARELDNGALADQIGEARADLRNLRFQHATHQLQNTARFAVVRRTIARLLTIQRERELSRGGAR